MVRNINKRGSRPRIDITHDTWLKHFKTLFSDIRVIDEQFKNEVNGNLNTHDTEYIICENSRTGLLNGQITVAEIDNVIQNLPNNKSAGIDGLLYEMFKASSDIIKPLLLALFNKILNIGIYPDQWSLAIISPLHKNGKRNNPTNYRGISLLCTVSKIFTTRQLGRPRSPANRFKD